jgi:hypothetical protein
MFHLGLRFFGLQPHDRANLVLEPTFILMYYCGFSYSEVQTLPVQYKRWFIDRLNTEISTRGKDEGTRAAHQNTPDVRELQGRMRNQVPSRLSRFT